MQNRLYRYVFVSCEDLWGKDIYLFGKITPARYNNDTGEERLMLEPQDKIPPTHSGVEHNVHIGPSPP